MICSSDGFTNILNVDIYIRKNKIKTQFQEKNWRFIVSKFVKLSDEFIESETFDMMTG